jgi:hypothetical protein
MTIEQITENTAALNAATPTPAKKKKKAAPAAVPEVSPDAMLAFTVDRIVAALNLQASGVTAEVMIARVKAYEAEAYGGLVQ